MRRLGPLACGVAFATLDIFRREGVALHDQAHPPQSPGCPRRAGHAGRDRARRPGAAAGPGLHAAAAERHLQDERRQGPRRFRARRRHRQGRACQGRAAALLPCGRLLFALADVGIRPGRAYRRDAEQDGHRRLRARQSRVRLRQGELPQAHRRPDLSDLRRQSARCRRQSAARAQGFADLRARRLQGRRHRHRLRSHAADLEPRRPQILLDDGGASPRGQGPEEPGGRHPRRRRPCRPGDGQRDRALARRRHSAHRPRPRSRHRL